VPLWLSSLKETQQIFMIKHKWWLVLGSVYRLELLFDVHHSVRMDVCLEICNILACMWTTKNRCGFGHSIVLSKRKLIKLIIAWLVTSLYAGLKLFILLDAKCTCSLCRGPQLWVVSAMKSLWWSHINGTCWIWTGLHEYRLLMESRLSWHHLTWCSW